eukprot:scaffold2118_cov153-Pinguiococcus_pyrenoidosus.AAC.1
MVRKASPLRRGRKAPPLRLSLAPKPREGFGPSVSPDVPRSVCGCTPIAFLQKHAAGCAASMIGRFYPSSRRALPGIGSHKCSG